MVHIPYKSGGLSVQSVLAGDTQVTFATAPSVMPHVLTGKLRGLAVTTRGRSPLVEGLPGMEEAGLANYDVPSGTDFSRRKRRRGPSSRGCSKRRRRPFRIRS